MYTRCVLLEPYSILIEKIIAHLILFIWIIKVHSIRVTHSIMYLSVLHLSSNASASRITEWNSSRGQLFQAGAWLHLNFSPGKPVSRDPLSLSLNETLKARHIADKPHCGAGVWLVFIDFARALRYRTGEWNFFVSRDAPIKPASRIFARDCELLISKIVEVIFFGRTSLIASFDKVRLSRILIVPMFKEFR